MLITLIFLVNTCLWAPALAAAGQAPDSCRSVGLDYTDNGSYLIDGSASGNFSFASSFEGTCEGLQQISPKLRDQDNNKQYSCSPISPSGVQISTCSIPYSRLTTGSWQIILPYPGAASSETRSFRLTVASPSTVVTTATRPSPATTTITSTTRTTLFITLPPTLSTIPCNTPATLTSTLRLPPTTVTEIRTVLEYSTTGKTTYPTTVTSTLIPTCRFPSASASSSQTQRVTRPPPATTTAPPPPPGLTGAWTFTVSGSTCVGNPPWGGNGGGRPGWGGGGGGGWGGGGGRGGGWGRGPPAWVTSQWGDGVGVGEGGSLPAWITCSTAWRGGRMARRTEGVVTATRTVGQTVYETITPPVRTVCVALPDKTEVVTVPGPRLTVLSIATSVTQVVETVFVTKTILTISNDMVSASACWNSGGVYGV
ncbi:hypothetical protein QBC42DRAFT_285222 [Cladorrhinum samala]|uniref:Uncharacterized protein n=1 Tax=Cladorrhinum samala TaxID=585594 RepID=A0AAV9HS53_9PEZI|nr:hypothetical protein QBC42DRAFT_285222 [Cladorrhinum samala]